MSANVENMFSANGITPWHREGTIINGAVSFEEGWKLSGHDFEVEKFQMHTPEGDAVDNVYGTRRKDTGQILTRCKVVSDNWEPIQNRDGWRVLEPLIETGQVTLETAGVLDHGRKVWILGCLTAHQSAEVAPGDEVKFYILFANGHDGTMAVTIGTTSIRVVCANTLAMAEQEGTLVRFRHVEGSLLKLENAAEMIARMGKAFEVNTEVYRKLAKVQVKTTREVVEYVAAVFGKEERKAQKEDRVSIRLRNVLDNFEGAGMGSDLEGSKGTAWGLYNALTEYVSHNRENLDSLAFGNRARILQRGLDAAVLGFGKGIPLDEVFDDNVVERADEKRWATL
jgi:phage/plasmid-like protein (TIGR03299 family)